MTAFGIAAAHRLATSAAVPLVENHAQDRPAITHVRGGRTLTLLWRAPLRQVSDRLSTAKPPISPYLIRR